MAVSRAQKDSFRIVEQAYALVGIMHMIGALKPFFGMGSPGPDSQIPTQLVTEGSLSAQIFGTAIYMTALILLLPRYKEVVALASRNKALVAFVGIILISALWSDLPEVTLRRSLALFGTTIFALYLALQFAPSELLKLVAIGLGFTAVESLLLVLLVPEVAANEAFHYGAWAGALGHKNIFGRTMVLGALVMWIVLPQARALKPVVWTILALSLIEVAMSQSRTAWVAGTCLVLAIPFLRYLRGSQGPMAARIFLVALIGIGGLGFLVLQFADVGLETIGRDSTFTGRTSIWESAFAFGMERPILGHGYRTFWTRGLTNRLLIGNGHNSFLDLWLELGLVGLGAFIASFVVVVRRALKRLAQSEDRRGLWYIMFLIFLFLFSMAAQVFPDHGTIPWVLYVTTALYLTPFAQERVLDRTRGPLGQPARRIGAPLPAD